MLFLIITKNDFHLEYAVIKSLVQNKINHLIMGEVMDEMTSNIDSEQIDLSKLFTHDELKLKRKSTSKIFNKGKILCVYYVHFWIYLVFLLVSLGILAAYCCVPDSGDNTYLVVLMSIGASIFGGVLLAYFIEIVSERIQNRRRILMYNNSVYYIFFVLESAFLCRPFGYMKKIEETNGKKVIAEQFAAKFTTQFNITIQLIDSLLLQNADIMGPEIQEGYNKLKYQLVQFIGSLSAPTDTENLIDVLDGSRQWLKNYYTKEQLKSQFLFY